MTSVIKLAESAGGEIPDEYDMEFGQMVEIICEHEKNLFDMVYCAFEFGYLQGMRRQKDEK